MSIWVSRNDQFKLINPTNVIVASRPTTRTKATVAPALNTFPRNPRPHTPDSQSSRNGSVGHVDIADQLSTQFNNIVVTPPSSHSGPRRRTKDSAGGATPTPKERQRKDSHQNWRPEQFAPRQTIADELDSDL